MMMAAIAAILVLSSCNNDQEIPVVDVSNTPINFITNINSSNTRAGHDSGTLTEGSFGLYLVTVGADRNDPRFNTANREMTYVDGAWTSPEGATQLLWKDNNTVIAYKAYTPYIAAMPDDYRVNPLSVPAEQTAANIKAADFLYTIGNTTGAISGTTGIALNFEHKMAQLKVTLKKGTELADALTFTKVELQECASLATTINMIDGTVAAPTDAQTNTISMLKNSETEFECILVPQTFASNLVVKITDSNGVAYYYSNNETLPFNSGRTYTLPLTVGRDVVETGGFTANSWGDNIAGGDLGTE